MTAATDERFDQLFAAHHDEVLAFALRRTNGRQSAEDVVAETFAVAWRRRDEVSEQSLGWLYAVALRVIANQRRGEQRRGRLVERLSRERGENGRVDDPAWLVGDRDGIVGAFTRLTEDQREVLMLVAWDGADDETGGRALGCTPAAFRSRLSRARKALDEAMTEEEKETR